METNQIEIRVPEEYHLDRADRFIHASLELDFSRSYLQKLIRGGHVRVNDGLIKPNYKVKTDDLIVIVIPEPVPLELEPEDIPIDFVYQDSSIAVINKQAGLVVHPGPGNWSRTLVNGLLHHLGDLSSIGGVARPGIVHRLDKDTAGLMVVAKTDGAHRFLSGEFAARRVRKRYAAVVVGKPRADHELIDRPIARHRKYRHKMTVDEEGRDALTEYRVSQVWNGRPGVFSLLDVDIHTGRTHQIRVHLSSIGIPIVGDPVYSKKWEKYRVPHLLLASVSLGFAHPEDGRMLSFEVDRPPHMKAFLDKITRLS